MKSIIGIKLSKLELFLGIIALMWLWIIHTLCGGSDFWEINEK